MAVNIPTTTIEGAIAAKVGNVDPTTPVLDLRALQKYASDVGAEALYDSAGALPESTDTNVGSTYFVKGATEYDGNSVYLSLGGGTNFQLQDTNTPTANVNYLGQNYGFLASITDSPPGAMELERYNFSSGASITSSNFATIGNRPAEVGDVVSAKIRIGGGVSDTARLTAYQTGGESPGAPEGNISIHKFSMVSESKISVYNGELTEGRYSITNSSDVRGSQGFTLGGRTPPTTSPPYRNTIDKFSFSSEANAVDAGDLTLSRFRFVGLTDTVNDYGYSVGGGSPSPTDRIDRFPFSSPFTSATDIGNLATAGVYMAGGQSSTNGYAWGGNPGTTQMNKFPFATPFVTATQVYNFTETGGNIRIKSSPTSSTDHMYIVAGFNSPSPFNAYSNIRRFPFASENSAEDVGTLSPAALYMPAGTQSMGTSHQY